MADDSSNPLSPSSSWVSSRGDVAHPDAPRGGGGPGAFRDSRSLGVPGNSSDPIPHPDSPCGRCRVLTPDDVRTLAETGVPVEVDDGSLPPATPLANAPPVTVAHNFSKTKQSTKVPGKPDVDIDVLVMVKDDGRDSAWFFGAKCVVDKERLQTTYPKAVFNASNIVTGFDGSYKLRGAISIQIIYGSMGSAGTYLQPDATAAYGRGTTARDKKAGNTTVGFHERCHMDQYEDWLKTKPLPEPKVNVGQTENQFEAALTACDKAIEKYFDDQWKLSYD